MRALLADPPPPSPAPRLASYPRTQLPVLPSKSKPSPRPLSTAGNPKSGGPSKAAATKWEAALKAVQSGQVLVPDGARSSQAQLDAQFLRQKIETEARPARPTLHKM